MELLADVLGTTRTQRSSIDDDDDDDNDDDDDDDNEDRYRCYIGKSEGTVKRCWIVES